MICMLGIKLYFRHSKINTMQKPLFAFLFFCIASLSAHAQFPSQNVTLLSQWDTSITVAEPVYAIRYNSIWGWTDPQDNKEYAIIGATDGTYIIDVTIPTAPLVRDYVKGRRDSCIWREYKTYQNYLYAVSDDGVNAFNQNSLQIIDLSPLPDSVQVVYDNNNLVSRAHTIFIDADKMYLNSVNMPNNGGHSNMAVFSLINPVNPILMRRLEQDFPSSDNVHDCYVRNDTCYASSSYGGLFIYKFSGSQFSLLGSLTSYPDQGYNHSSALTADGQTLIFTDEVPTNLALKSLDVSNMGNLTVLDVFKSTSSTIATPHNPFIRKGDNNRVVVAYYQDGVQIFDISNPSNISRTGFFDTNPTDCPSCPNPSYSGCWGAYVDLPSGIIVASDMQNGLFVLDATSAGVGTGEGLNEKFEVKCTPNPFFENFDIRFSLSEAEQMTVELTDISGKILLKKEMSFSPGNNTFTVNGKYLANGIYQLSMQGKNLSYTTKITKTNR